MYIKEITKETIFIKRIGDAFFVDERENEGIKTIRTTKNPLKAQHYTLENIIPEIYTALSEREAERIIRAHEEKDTYNSLFSKIAAKYVILSTVDVNYGYGGDLEAERKLLTELHMDYIFTPTKTVIEEV